MLQFSEPILLSAAAGVLIPIAIHLWNIRKGKTLRVGSIELLSDAARRRSSSWRITEAGLLALRCLFVLLLAALLARPYWQPDTDKGWIVMERSVSQRAYEKWKPLIDSLSAKGYTIHAMEKGFPVMQPGDTLAYDAGVSMPGSYWEQLVMLDRQLPAHPPVYLFTGNRLSRFTGTRPLIPMPLQWRTVGETDSVTHFLAAAYQDVNDSIVAVIGTSSPSSTVFHKERVALDKPRQNDLSLEITDGKLQLRYRDGIPVEVDTAVLHVTLFGDVNTGDVGYLSAALASIREVDKRRIQVTIPSQPKDVPAMQDGLFWLSSREIPKEVKAKYLFRYAQGEPHPLHSWMETGGVEEGEKIGLYQRIASSPTNNEVIWRDGYGETLLTRNKDKSAFTLFTHFDPAWNDMVWHASFPEWMQQVLYAGDTAVAQRIRRYDRRSVNETALRFHPSPAQEKYAPVMPAGNETAQRITWLLLFLCFALERIVSFRSKKETVIG